MGKKTPRQLQMQVVITILILDSVGFKLTTLNNKKRTEVHMYSVAKSCLTLCDPM